MSGANAQRGEASLRVAGEGVAIYRGLSQDIGPIALSSVRERPDLPVGLFPLAYPTFGEEHLREPALRVTHADGATSTRLRSTSWR